MKARDCRNCRWRVWKEKPKGSPDPCGGCVTYSGMCSKWKRRKLWQMVRDNLQAIYKHRRKGG